LLIYTIEINRKSENLNMTATTRLGKEEKEIEAAKIYFNRDRLKDEFKDIKISFTVGDGEATKPDIFFSLLDKKISSLIEDKATSPVVLRFAIEEFKALHTEFLKLYAQVPQNRRALNCLRDNVDILYNHLMQDTNNSAAFFRNIFTGVTQPKRASGEEKDLDSLAHQCYIKIQELAQDLFFPEDKERELPPVAYVKHIPLYINLKKKGLRVKKINEDKDQNIELRQGLAKLILTSLTFEEKDKKNREALLKFQDNVWETYVGLPTVEHPYSEQSRLEYHLLKLHNVIYFEKENKRNSIIKATFFDLIKLFNESRVCHSDPLSSAIINYCSLETIQILACKDNLEKKSSSPFKVAPNDMLAMLTNLNALSKRIKEDGSIESTLRKVVYENIVTFFLQELSFNNDSQNVKKLSELVYEVDARLRGKGTPGKLEALALHFPIHSSVGKFVGGIVCLVLGVWGIFAFSSINDTFIAVELWGGGTTALILMGIGLIHSARPSELAKSINQVIGAKPLSIPPPDAALINVLHRYNYNP
jgi:hypothetical protein